MSEPYADIHHFKAENRSEMVDVDGDPMLGWYFQLMEGVNKPLTELVGPYGSHSECEGAALKEWGTLAA